MTTKTEHTEKREGTPFENIKQLNSLLQQGGGINAVLGDVRALRRNLDGLINDQRAALAVRQEEAAIKKEAERPAPPPPPEKKVAPIIHATPAEKSQEAPREEKRADFVKPEPPKEEKPKPQAGFEATSQKFMPSYIRGVATPVPPRPEAPKRGDRPPYQQGQSRPYGDRPPYQQGQSRPYGDRPPYQQGQGRPYGDRPPYQQGQGRPPYGQSAGGPRPLQRLLGGAKAGTLPPPPVSKDRKVGEKKKEYKTDERKTQNKRTLIRKGFIVENIGEERMGSRKLKVKRQKDIPTVAKRVEKAIITTPNLTVKILSEKIGKTAQEIIKQLMVLGIMTSVNSVVDFATMELVASELGVEIELKLEQTKESLLEEIHEEADVEENLVKRPPIITVMGHVDHGKTSLLDAIRNTNVASGEAGLITQHIGAYSVVCRGERITFLDTPGHEAFTQLRARGAKVTDIAILIVAADDGVMPQTVEAINHAKAANVPILVAINKIDKPGADIEKIRKDLTQYNLIAEEWGGDTIMVPISAKRGDGIDKLLEMVLFMAEYNNYRANPDRSARGLIIESRLDRGKGPVANAIVQNGTLKVGDFVVSGMTCGRVRAMTDEKGASIKIAPPSTPVSILGLSDVPGAGDPLYVVQDEKMARQIIEERNVKMRFEQANQAQKASLDELIGKINQGMLKELNLIVKADVQGSADALKASLLKLSTDEVRVSVVHSGVGAVSKSDIMLAEVSKAIIVGFNVKPDAECRSLAEKAGIEVRQYGIIYDAIDDIERAVKGLTAPKYREVILGRAQVRNVFKITGVGMVAGSYILNGKMQRHAKARVFRDGKLVHEGSIEGLKRFKEDVKEVGTGYECGITVSDYTDIAENDEIEAYLKEEIKD